MGTRDIKQTVIDQQEDLRLRRQKTEMAIEREQTELAKIVAQLAIIDTILKEAGAGAKENGSALPSRSGRGGDLGPSDAIRELLRRRPGMTGPQIIDELEDKVETSAQNVRHNIRTTLYNLARTKKIDALEDDTYQLAPE